MPEAVTVGIVPGKAAGAPEGRFTQEHLMLMVAIGHQAGLAIENTAFYQAKLQAERLAAVGQTIATLSHHIKNILQGIRGGSYLIDMGLNDKDDAIVRRGWTIVEKNQAKIYNLVMDMLSYLQGSRARPGARRPERDGRRRDRADAVSGGRIGRRPGVVAGGRPAVLDDRPRRHPSRRPEHRHQRPGRRRGAARRQGLGRDDLGRRGGDRERDGDRQRRRDRAEELGRIFQVFASTKGTRGTGLGLPVSQKIIREHGGQILPTSQLGKGSMFVIELPLRRPEGKGTGDQFETIA